MRWLSLWLVAALACSSLGEPTPRTTRSFAVNLTGYENACYEGDTLMAVRDSGQFKLTMAAADTIRDTVVTNGEAVVLPIERGLAQGTGELHMIWRTNNDAREQTALILLGPMHALYTRARDTLQLWNTQPQDYLAGLPWRDDGDALVLEVYFDVLGYIVGPTEAHCGYFAFRARSLPE